MPDASAIAQALAAALENRKEALRKATGSETGLVAGDVDETLAGCLEVLRRFSPAPASPIGCKTSVPGRSLEIRPAPWGTVVAILPQNAFLILAVTCLIHALDAGNRVVLRAPAGSGRSAEILADALAEAGATPQVCVVAASAQELLEGFYASSAPGLVHYFGGSGRIPDLLEEAFRAGKGVIADGEGNTWVYVAGDFEPSRAAEILAGGAVRYNGQTCTSVNGAIIHPDRYGEVAAILRERFERIGRADVGPLADEEQTVSCLETAKASGGKILSGGSHGGGFLQPILVESPAEDSRLVREGVFGPVLWISPGREEDFRRLWPSNRYPLCAGVLSAREDPSNWVGLANLARLVVNGDPSLEDPIEPWGGYPRSGNSIVSDWHSKYRRLVQIDRPDVEPAHAVIAYSE